MKEQIDNLAKKYADSYNNESNYDAFIAGAEAQKEIFIELVRNFLKKSTYNSNGRLMLYKSTFVELFEDLKEYIKNA